MLSLKSFHFSLESATVSRLRSPQFAIFGRRLLPFLVVAVWIFWKCFLRKLPLSSKPVSCYHCQMLLPWVSQNKMLCFPGIGPCFFFKLGIESHMVMIWERQAWFFFKAVPFSLGSELTAETSKGMCAAGSRWFFFSTTSLPAVVFMIRGRRSRHLWVLAKRQIFNGIHPSWVTLNRQPGGVGGVEQQKRGSLVLSALTSRAYNKLC